MFWFMGLPRAKAGAKDTTEARNVKRSDRRAPPATTFPRSSMESLEPPPVGGTRESRRRSRRLIERGTGLLARAVRAARELGQPGAGLRRRQQRCKRFDQDLRIGAAQSSRQPRQLAGQRR